MSFFARLKEQLLRRGPAQRRLLFVFGGASHNWRGPGQELYSTQPVFRAAVDAAESAVRASLGFSVGAMFRGEWSPSSEEEQRRSDIISMGLLHIGLADLWTAHGVAPEGALGLSLGEVSAAYVAGAIDRSTAIRIYCAIAGHVDARADEHILFVAETAADAAQTLCVAAPAPLYFAGETAPGNASLLTPAPHGEEIRAYLRGRAAILAEHPTKWPYHVPTDAFDPKAAAAELAGMAAKRPDIPVYLASLGRRVADQDRLGPHHWTAMVAGSYFLAGASRAAFDDGFDLLLNIGTASIGQWVDAGAPPGADVRRFDATPGHAGPMAWKLSLDAVKTLHTPPPAVRPPPVDLAAPEVLANPFPTYERLRAGAAVQFLPRQNFWIVLGYDDVKAAFKNTEQLSNRSYAKVGPVLMAQDPPEHLAVRRLLSDLFAPVQIARQVEEVERVAEGLIGSRFDLVTGFARPLAEALACYLLRIPASASPGYRRAAQRYQEQDVDIEAYVQHLDALAAESGLLSELLQRGDDVLTEDRGRQLIRFLWMAATETIERVIVRAMLVLFEDGALRDRIEEDPGLLEAFVDEVIRLYPPEMMVPRTTIAPVRLGGVKIAAGQHVMLSLAAANRDPARFEEPAAIRLDRPLGRHLSFGAGIHKCSGTAMSGPVLRAALKTLLDTAPRLQPAEPLHELSYYNTMAYNRPRRLLVAQ